MKKLSFIAIPLIVVMMFVGCSHNAEVSKNTDESLNVSVSTSNLENSTDRSVTEFESSTQISITETTTTQTNTTKPKKTEKSTTAKTTTAKPAEQKSAGQTTTKKVTTTQKSITTKKQTTTKKVTTSAPYWCDEGGTHHSCDVGPIGWVNSYAEAQKKALRYIDSYSDSGNFLVKECHNCGKFTAYITLD